MKHKKNGKGNSEKFEKRQAEKLKGIEKKVRRTIAQVKREVVVPDVKEN